MTARVDTTNRLVLALLGLLLLAVAAAGAAVALGAVGDGPAEGPVLPEAVRSGAAGLPWLPWALAGAGLVIALLSLAWLLAQLRTERVGALDLTESEREGTTTLAAGALTRAVVDEVEALRGVRGASAHLRDHPSRRLWLGVDLDDRADVAAVRRAVREEAVPHVRRAVDDPGLPVDVELHLTGGSPRGRGLR